ncbi:MAG: 16S rRNA (cytosine(967)-C(5))-methyltransferase RsmB [Clostridiales Family XIII bacterium]|jgi:16S rRNA (cytosine967-C5)-methyltransferase|nr:16S rRNA (cytosine(967)-C(5))-methyltransferase RsmB [Clostridiales Family XIII bacterium]
MDKNRFSAYYTLMDIERNLAYSNIALKRHIKRGRPDSPAFVRELTYGVLKNRMYLDFIIGNFVKTPVDKLRTSDLILLRMGLYQLIFMGSVPEYAAVSATVDMAKRFSQGHDGFINGVLRQYLRDKDYLALPERERDEVAYLSVKYSYAPWIVKLWLADYGSERAEAMLAAGNKTPVFSVRVNRLRTSREEAMGKLQEKGFEARPGSRAPMCLLVEGSNLLYSRLYTNGFFSVQDESSQIAAEISGASPGETVIDVCAAPGGKTLAMAERMGNKGKIHSWDVYKRRLALLERDARRLGVTIVETKTWDAARVSEEMLEAADRVFVDVPCSGLGVTRRKPEIKYKEGEDGEDGLAGLHEKQRAILAASAEYVKPGGCLIYATCTISRHENQDVVNGFLKKNRAFEVQETAQLFPDVDNMDGFFVCRMRRNW